MLVPEPTAAQAWYVQHFSAVAGKRLGGVGVVRSSFDTANVPGTEITLSKVNAPMAPTKGRAYDHIGFEVRDIDAVVARLQAAGLKMNGPVRNSTNAAGLRIVYLTDPWGTEIEITRVSHLRQSRPAYAQLTLVSSAVIAPLCGGNEHSKPL